MEGQLTPRFALGQKIRVRQASPPGHARTPYYVRGRVGIVAGLAGVFANPEELAYGRAGLPRRALYRIRFRQQDLWPDYRGDLADSTIVDIFEHWLEPLAEANA